MELNEQNNDQNNNQNNTQNQNQNQNQNNATVSEPVTQHTESVSTRIEGQNAKRIIGVVFGAIEVLIAFRFAFKLFGANPDNGFVKFMYSLTGLFVDIFEGIFNKVTIGGSGSIAVFEPASIIAAIIIALIALLVLKLITPKDKNTKKTSFTSSTKPGNN